MNCKTAYQEAIATYRSQSLKLKISDNVDRRLGKIFQGQKQTELAISAYQRAIANSPQPAWVYQSLGLLWQESQQIELATIAYQTAIELDAPQPAWVYQNLGYLWQQQKRVELAIEAYQQAIANSPQPAWVYRSLGYLFQEQKKTDLAIAAYQRAIAIDSQQPAWVYQHIAAILSEQNQLKEAVLAYQKAIEIAPELASTIYPKIANLLNRQGKSIEAKIAYQQASYARSIYNISLAIDYFLQRYFPWEGNKLNIDILDNGCEPTGIQLSLLAQHTNGRVVGTNICQGFPEVTVEHRRDNTEFYWMDGQKLSFEDSSFDAIISLNVLEHVPNPKQYLQECCRVLRSQGLGYFSWYPIWSGATGHHVHPDMIDGAARRLGIKPPQDYDLDGKIIPFWSHLWLSAAEMFCLLTEKHQYHPLLARWIVNYIYQGQDLNRCFWQDILGAFQSLPWKKIEVNPTLKDIPRDILPQLKLKYRSVEDFKICGAKIIVQKS